MRLDQGLFKLDFNDHYAVLGLPIDADGKVVRKRYLQIARKLHPDSMSGSSSEAIRKASDTLSKLVNPAYETLSQEKASTEYQLVLKLRGKTLQQSQAPPEVDTAPAQQLLNTTQPEAEYRQAVRALATQQYEQLESLEAVIGQLSELNLVYLYRTGGGDGEASTKSAPKATTSPRGGGSTSGQSEAPPTPPRRVRNSILESYINRAQDCERTKDTGKAILELREALKTYPNSAECHSYLANLYLKSGQATMAKIHAKRSLAINPNDEQAKAVQSRVERSNASESTKGKKQGNSSNKGGGFFGLFGGKKK
mgnify:FL=1